MSHVIDYDLVADRFGRRYALHAYDGVKQAVLAFAAGASFSTVEVGCGSGHWLAVLEGKTARLAGVDPSRRMLAQARTAAPSALIVRGRATPLPFAGAAFDRVICVNALHHFGDRQAFFVEARRVLRAGGGLLTVGLDPHAERDRWWVYDYFAGAREFDAERFAPVRIIRGELARAGFAWTESQEVDRIETRVGVAEAFESGVLDRGFTSELTILSDAEYEGGLRRIRQAEAERVASGGVLELITDLRLYATAGWV